MQIEIAKSIPKQTRKIMRAAILISHAHAPMNATRIMVKPVKLRHNCAGFASMNGKIATIRIDPTDPDFLDTIYHECYHLHQMANGDLVQEYGGFTWKNTFIPTWAYRIFYKFIPFERQAYRYAARMLKTQ